MHAPTTQIRDRRPAPGSRAFVNNTGPSMIVCGTRAGVRQYRERLAKLPQHYMLAPLDMDPGSVQWPVKDAPGITIVVAGAPTEYVLRLTQALLADGAHMVMQLHNEPVRVSFHQRHPT